MSITVRIINSLVNLLNLLGLFSLCFIEFVILANLLSTIFVNKPWLKIVSIKLEEASLDTAHVFDFFFKSFFRIKSLSLIKVRMN